MKKLIITSVIVCWFISLSANAAKNTEVFDYDKSSRLGFNALTVKSYDKAFEHLEKASKLGNKAAQYSLALLYLEGKGTSQDYGQAYVWLNVASEVKEKTWRKLRDKLHNALTTKQINMLKPLVDSYMTKYGADAQDISCEKSAATGSRRKIMTCTKNLDSSSPRL